MDLTKLAIAVVSGDKKSPGAADSEAEKRNMGHMLAEDFLAAVESKKPSRLLSAFKALYVHCCDEHEKDDSDEVY